MPKLSTLLAAALLATLAACTEELAPDPHAEHGGADGIGAEAKVAVDNDPGFVGLVMPTSCTPPKVLLCHIPLGNPANAHNICVSEVAVSVHEAQHGDVVGDCQAAPIVAPVCLPLLAECSTDANCCSNACVWNECIHRI